MATSVRQMAPQNTDAGATSRVVIGFINNMPDAAIRSSERQFRGMLRAGAEGVEVILKGFYCRQIPRSDVAKTIFLHPYCEIDRLWGSDIDGLIVTGTEPRAEKLTDEPCWPLLSRLVEWAEEKTISTMWSCLAAHAAVFRLSGISRKPLMKKMSGLFECTAVAAHPLLSGLPGSWLNPHSRHNDLPEAELLQNGFQPLIKLAADGLDTFMMQRKSLFVFFQGHPEYDPESLLLEYMRDVKRYVEGERDVYPDAPTGYFDTGLTEKLEELRHGALRTRDIGVHPAVTRLLQGHQIKNVWREPSTIIYRNWLNLIAAEKSRRASRTATAV